MIILRKFITRLLSGCWAGHPDLVYARDEDHRLVRYCTACRLQYPILASQIVRGPRSIQEPVLGTPNIKAVLKGSRGPKVVGRIG